MDGLSIEYVGPSEKYVVGAMEGMVVNVLVALVPSPELANKPDPKALLTISIVPATIMMTKAVARATIGHLGCLQQDFCLLDLE